MRALVDHTRQCPSAVPPTHPHSTSLGNSRKGEGRPMLVLSRRLNESFFIAGNIQVTVLALQGRVVKLGISAPPDVEVLREELVSERSAVQPAAP
jgi:carbon storage regulator